MIDPDHPRFSIRRQCGLVSISRASFYRQPAAETPENLELMRNIDEAFMETPWYGSRQMARHLRRQGWCIGRKRVRRLMRKIGLSPIYQTPKTSEAHPQHRIYPHIHGRARPLNGQRLHRAVMAQPQIRVRLPQRLRDRQRRATRHRFLDRLLQ